MKKKKLNIRKYLSFFILTVLCGSLLWSGFTTYAEDNSPTADYGEKVSASENHKTNTKGTLMEKPEKQDPLTVQFLSLTTEEQVDQILKADAENLKKLLDALQKDSVIDLKEGKVVSVSKEEGNEEKDPVLKESAIEKMAG